ncbi:MAG: sugar ABC transporter ATP-binding protein, partial [Bryobacteraceae bacterium]
GRLRSEGVGVIYISHRLEEIATIADRVTVLRDGESVATRRMDEVDRAELIRTMVGRELASLFPKREIAAGEIGLELRDVSCGATGVKNVSLQVRKGEILGIAGLVGSGRTELAETIFGLTPADSGEIRVHGERVSITSPRGAIQRGIGYVPEDRPRHGVILGMSIAANTSLANLKNVAHHGLIDRAEERAVAEKFQRQLRIKTPSVAMVAGSLSGGNQQKVALARWLAIDPRVLILDEPTQGVDVGSKAEIHALMADLAKRGLAIIMISSELPELLGMSDRIAVMHAGGIAGTLDRKDATQQRILSLALGHAA